jgi:hypothetical protein
LSRKLALLPRCGGLAVGGGENGGGGVQFGGHVFFE